MHHHHCIDHVKDGGYKSRKMVMAYAIMVMGVGAYAMTAKFPALAASLSELYMFLLGAASLFISGNVAVKWMSARGGAPFQSDLTPQLDPLGDPRYASNAPQQQKPAPVVQAPAKPVGLPPDPDMPRGR